MRTYLELYAHPEVAATFGAEGFRVSQESFEAIRGQARLQTTDETRLDAVEFGLLKKLEARIKAYIGSC